MCHCSFGTNRRCQLLCKQDLTHVPTSAIHLKIYYFTTFHQTTYCLWRGQIAARLLSIRIAGEVKSFWFSPGCPQRSALGTNIISKRKVAVQGCPLVTTIDHRSNFLSRQPNWKKASLAGEAPNWSRRSTRLMQSRWTLCNGGRQENFVGHDGENNTCTWTSHEAVATEELNTKKCCVGRSPSAKKLDYMERQLMAEDWMTLGPSLRKWQLRARTLSASSPRLIRLTWYKQSACTNATGN